MPQRIIDLRAAALRDTQPLPPQAPHQPAPLALSLDDIEEGRHGLTASDGPLLVVCERGTRSALAARFLRADGLDARAWEGSWAELRAALEGGQR